MSGALISAGTPSPAFVPAAYKSGDALFGPRLIVLSAGDKRGSLTSAIGIAGPIGSAFLAVTCALGLSGLLAALVFPD
jgi:hypothetical protein